MSKPRTLTVILAADAVGYSRLSAKDETAALAAVTWFRERAAEIVSAHDGRIFFRAGDGVMAELPTARAGVLTALELAETVRARVAHGDRAALPVRIGLHLGEVAMEDDGDRLGHDVNVAARIQQAAEPGEVLASRALADMAKGKVDAHFERVGAERLKNLTEPVEMFRVVGSASAKRLQLIAPIAGAAAAAALVIGGVGWLVGRGVEAEPATTAAATETAPLSTAQLDTPSIAVLPFVNMSSDPEQEYFSDGLSDQLMNQLAQIEGLKVAGRTSSFVFKGRNASFQEIGETLGVATVLEGSVQRSGNQIRIIAQLVNVEDGFHLWSQTYNRELDDVFAVQDQIAMAVADALSITLGVGERGTDYGGTRSFEAYDHYLRGRALVAGGGIGPLEEAISEFGRAAEIDPAYALAWAEMARAAALAGIYDSARFAEFSALQADALNRALAVAPDLASVAAQQGGLLTGQLRWIDAARVFEAIDDPDTVSPDYWAQTYGGFLLMVGRIREGAPLFEVARDSEPLSLASSGYASWALALAGRLDAAIAEHQRSANFDGNRSPWDFQQLCRLLERDDRPAVRALFDTDAFGGDGMSARLRTFASVWENPEEALAVLRGALDDPDIVGPYRLGNLAALAGYYNDTDLALELLREEFFGRSGAFPVYLWSPLLAQTRRTEDFKDIVRQLGLVDYWRETGDWSDFCRPLGDDDFECF